MRALTPTLEAAQRASSAVPYVRVRVRDYDLGVPRLRWQRWYTGSEDAGPCAAAAAADGSLLRARIDAATGALYHSRVAMPSAASTYSTWTSLGTVDSVPRLALAAAETRALLVTVRSGGLVVEVRESTDSGATFAASSALTTAAGAVTAVACTLQPDGTAAVFYAVAGVVYAIERSGTGSWSSPSSWTLTLATVTGLAACFDLDHQLLVSGTTSAGVPGVWTTTLGAGGAAPPDTWLPLIEVTAASPGIGMSYLATGLAVAGVSRATFVETHTGSTTSHRAHLVTALADTTFADQQWRDPRPLEVAGADGVALASLEDHAWLVTFDGVWHALADLAVYDLTDEVLELDLHQAYEDGRVHLVLRGDEVPDQQSISRLSPGGELLIEPGYLTPAGLEVSEGLRFWITRVRRRLAHGTATIEVDGSDAWGILDTWTASRQLVWPAGTISVVGVMAQLCARSGLRLVASDASTVSATLEPSFTVRAGERGTAALRRLLAMTPDHLVARGGELILHEPLSNESGTYRYGTEHAISSLRADEVHAPAGWVRVFGDGVFAEAIAPAHAAGGVTVVMDDNLATEVDAEVRAVSVLRRAHLATARGEIVCAPNVNQEVGDVIEVTSEHLGLNAARFRVASLRLRLARGGTRPTYEMTLTLGDT